MTRYQMAKLVQWAGTLRTRKRVQKLVFMLQAAGCPLEADYTLQVIGPYSQDVARVTDEMVQCGLLEEAEEASPKGRTFHYRLAVLTQERLSSLEGTPNGRQWASELAPYATLARELFEADINDLETAATTVYLRRLGNDWSVAVEKTCRVKGLDAESSLLTRAEGLARHVLAENCSYIVKHLETPTGQLRPE